MSVTATVAVPVCILSLFSSSKHYTQSVVTASFCSNSAKWSSHIHVRWKGITGWEVFNVDLLRFQTRNLSNLNHLTDLNPRLNSFSVIFVAWGRSQMSPWPHINPLLQGCNNTIISLYDNTSGTSTRHDIYWDFFKEETKSSIILCVYFISMTTFDFIYFYWHSIFTHVKFYSCCLVWASCF